MSEMRITRSDIDRYTSFMPKDVPYSEKFSKFHPRFDEVKDHFYTEAEHGWKQSVRQEIHMRDFLGTSWYGRRDVLLMNVQVTCGECGHDTKTDQFTVDYGVGGSLMGDISKFSEADLQWAREESWRCWEVALADPLVMKMWFGR
jgi:hypothetical protein